MVERERTVGPGGRHRSAGRHRTVGRLGAPSPTTRKWVVLGVVLLAEMMDLLDSTITGVAAPTIRAGLDGPQSLVQWLASGYTLPFAALLMTAGRLGDLLSQRRLFVVGALGFSLASLAAAAAPDPGLLIAARCAQGAAAALLVPQGFGLIRLVFPADEIRLAYSFFGPVLGLAAVGGPIVGGVLSSTDIAGLGWRVIFLLTVPLGIVAAVAAVVFVPVQERHAGRSVWSRLDYLGTVAVSAGMTAIIYPLIEGAQLGWPWWGFVSVGGGVAVLAALPSFWRRTRRPKLVQPTLFANRAFRSGIIVVLGFLGAFAGLLLVVSLFCQLGLGFSSTRTGLTLAPVAIGMVLTSPFAAATATTRGRQVIRSGLVLATLGCAGAAAAAAHFGAGTTLWKLSPPLLVAGLGIGLVFAPLFDLILAGVTKEQTGSASGLLNSTQQLAAAVGVAGLATIYLQVARHHAARGFALAMAATAGAFLVAAALARKLPAHSIDDTTVEAAGAGVATDGTLVGLPAAAPLGAGPDELPRAA